MIDAGCSPLIYYKVLLRGLLVLAVLVLGYVLVGVAPASAVTTWDIAVVRGTDNGVYWNSYNSVPSWGSWQSLGGATPSPPGICEVFGFGQVWVVVRGTDNGVYLKYWYAGAWSGWISPTGGGATIDQPACAYLYPFLHVVVRGVGNELYWNSYGNSGWSGWVDLHGTSASAPVLVSMPWLNRIDLVVQGTDNGIYHKAYTSGSWSANWDSPGGKTLSRPAAAFLTYVSWCPSCYELDYLELVVRGTDNNVYENFYEISPYTGWAVWSSLSGATLSAPTLAYDANGCSPGSTVNCNSIDALAVRGTDNAVYRKTFTGFWSVSWDSPGGSIANSPALAYVPGSSAQFLLLVQGNPSNNLYSNTVTGSTWGTYSSVSGATNSDPALAAVL